MGDRTYAVSRARDQIAAALADVARTTFVQPVQAGRPQPSRWPRGLAAIGAATAVVYIGLGLAAVFAVPLRRSGEVTVSYTSPTLPTVAVPLLLAGLLLSLALAHTAVLHSSWWLRIPVFLLGTTTAFLFWLVTPDVTWTISPHRPFMIAGGIAAYLALAAFTVARARRSYVWWEFVVVAALVCTATLLPWAGTGTAEMFVDPRPAALEGALINLQPLALPAIIVAALAPVQIVVTAAAAISTRDVGTNVFWTGATVIVIWFGFSTYASWGDLEIGGLVASALCLAFVTAGLALLLRRAGRHRPEPPSVYPEAWSPWLYPLATAIVASNVVMLPLLLLNATLPLFGLARSPIGQLLTAFVNIWQESNSGLLWRALLGVAALVLAWRRSRANRLGEAGFLLSFAVAVLLDAAGLLPGAELLFDRSPAGYGVIAGVIVLVVGGWLALRGRLTRERAANAVTVLLLAVLYPHRDVLSDPASAVLVFSVPLLLVFGLTWRVFTDAGFTRAGSRRLPQPTRILLFLANSLFAVTSIAYLSLTRGIGTYVDTTLWARSGELVLGDPLFVVALVAGMWLLAAGPPSLRTPAPDQRVASP